MKFQNKIFTLAVALICWISISGCVERDEFDHRLVVEGFIADGEYPKICLMQTVDPNQEGMAPSDMVVRWGKISISDGEKTVVLTGGPDKNYFPPYTYTTLDMKGEVGKTYTLTAEYDGLKVSATTTIPTPVLIDSIVAVPSGSDGSRRRLSLYLTSENKGGSGGSQEYYRILTRVRYIHTNLLPGFMGTADNAGESGVLSIPVNRPRTLRDTVGYQTDFLPHEELEIALCTMDRTAYDFWRDYDNAVAFGGSQFLTSSPKLRSNIEGGYGYFFGYGISRKYWTEKEIPDNKKINQYKIPYLPKP